MDNYRYMSEHILNLFRDLQMITYEYNVPPPVYFKSNVHLADFYITCMEAFYIQNQYHIKLVVLAFLKQTGTQVPWSGT